MPTFQSLPLAAEQRFVEYLAGGYTGSYAIKRAFTAEGYQEPCIIVKASNFKELEPQSHVFNGSLVVSIHTQIDDAAADPVSIHDSTVAEIYDLLAQVDALKTSVSTPGGNFYLHGYYLESYDQEADERSLITALGFTIHCQSTTPS